MKRSSSSSNIAEPYSFPLFHIPRWSTSTYIPCNS
jgi:hypothetical protein